MEMAANSIGDRTNGNAGALETEQPLPPTLVAGARVRVRGAAWRLDSLVSHEDCRELHLIDLRAGTRRVLLWPFDRPTLIDDARRLRVVRVKRWREGVSGAMAQAISPCTPRGRLVEGRVLPYQLAPAVAIAEGACRVLLADEVGLGKTVQAGWIVADLLARERDARILVAVPAGLREQWSDELSRRFAIACAAA